MWNVETENKIRFEDSPLLYFWYGENRAKTKVFTEIVTRLSAIMKVFCFEIFEVLRNLDLTILLFAALA